MPELVEIKKRCVHCYHHPIIEQKDMFYDADKEDAISHVVHELIVMLHGLEHRNNPNIKTLDEYYHFQTLIVQWVIKHIDDIYAKSAKDAADKLLSALLGYLSRRQLTLS